MVKRSVPSPWRHLGRGVALLAGLMIVGQPASAGEFDLDGEEGSPELGVYIKADKKSASPDEVIQYQLMVSNHGTATAPNTRVKLILIEHGAYVPGSTTLNGTPIADHFDGNPLLRGVPLGAVGPNQDVILGFKLKVFAGADIYCPVKVKAVAENENSPPASPPTTFVPVLPGKPNIVFEKVADNTAAVPGQAITYRLVLRNTGNGTATDVRVQDGIPRFTTYVPGSTQINGTAIADHLGSTPLEAGLSLGDVPAGGAPVVVSMKVIVNNTAPLNVSITNTARAGDKGTPDEPSNPVTTVVTDRPTVAPPGTPGVPNLVTVVPGTKPPFATGTPTEVVVCPTDCEPTSANIRVSTDASGGFTSTWLQVVGLNASGGATIQKSLGLTVSARMSREGLVAPFVDTIYSGTFPAPGGRVEVSLSLTPKAVQLAFLDQLLRQIAAQAGTSRPTALQVLSMYNRAGTVPSLKAALQSFGAYPAPAPLPVASDVVYTPRPASPAQVITLSEEMHNATQELAGLLYSSSEADAFREALQASTGHPFSNAHIRPVARAFAEDPGLLRELRDELSLSLSTRVTPAALSFVAYKTR